jgi:hypothetical protein
MSFHVFIWLVESLCHCYFAKAFVLFAQQLLQVTLAYFKGRCSYYPEAYLQFWCNSWTKETLLDGTTWIITLKRNSCFKCYGMLVNLDEHPVKNYQKFAKYQRIYRRNIYVGNLRSKLLTDTFPSVIQSVNTDGQFSVRNSVGNKLIVFFA